MSLTVRSALILATLSSFSSTFARAQERDGKHLSTSAGAAERACVQAYEQAQEQRQSGKLLQARVALESCARDACPDFIHTDCVAWYDALQAELPTVVFAARSGERDLTDVRISAGQRVLVSRIDGEAIELDPGEYDFEFTAPAMQPLTQHVLVSRGERNRLLRVELVPLQKRPPPPPPAAPTQSSSVLPAVLGGVAVVGLSSFGAFAAWGHSEESKLESSCSPHCSQDQISSVRTKYAIADVSLAVGVASLGLAAYFALTSGGEQRAAQTSPFDVQAGNGSLRATYRGTF